jgi:polyhydroxybutyrate depolymerase
MEMTDWHVKAEREGFLAVFPEATSPDTSGKLHARDTGQRWNNGAEYIKQLNITADDFGFIDSLLAVIDAEFNIDTNRVYTAGFSNGGSMALATAMELTGKIAAVATVSGVLGDKYEGRMLDKPVSMLFIVGTADPANPWDGGFHGPPKMNVKMKREPIVYNTVRWSELNGFAVSPEVVHENNGVKVTRYSQSENGAEVILCAVEGMGHAWPGGKANLPAAQWGQPSNKLNGTDLIWDFFRNHPAES